MKRKLSLLLLLLSLIGGSLCLAYSTNTYSWNSVAIGGGGYVTGTIFNPAQSGLLYARTDVGGAYRWNAATKTWTPLMDSIGKSNSSDMGVLSLAVDPTNANRVYAMTGLYTQSWAGNGNFYSSIDQGTTWTITPLSIKVGGNELGRGNGEHLQVDPNLPSRLFMGTTKDGLWRSDNNGGAWSKVTSFPEANVSFVILDSSSSTPGTATKRIIVGTTNTASSLYMSTDGGNTWSAISRQPKGMAPIRAAISSGNLYVTYSGFSNSADIPGPNGATSGAVYKYTISNSKWNNISPSTGSYGFGGISVDKQNPNNLIVSTLDRWYPGDEIYRSTDGGSTWKAVLSTGIRDESKAPYVKGSSPHWITDVQIDPFNSNNATFVTGYGLYMTANLTASTITWSFEDSGLEETVPTELKSPPSGTNLLSTLGDVTGFKHDVLTSSPANGQYNPGNGTNGSIDFAELTPSIVVRTHAKGTTSSGSYSTDGGVTWTQFTSAPPAIGNDGLIALSANGSNMVWTPRDTNGNLMGSYVSSNNGSSWTASAGIPTGLKPVSDRMNGNKFYAFDGLNGKVYASTDGGASFSLSASGLPLIPSWLLQEGIMKAVFGYEGHLWLTASSEGLYRSTDSGATFSKVTTVTEAYKVGFGKAAVTGGYPSIYIVGIVDGTYGFYRSDDQGATWVKINDSTHQFGYINEITGDPKVYGRVYLGTSGRGILYGDKQ